MRALEPRYTQKLISSIKPPSNPKRITTSTHTYDPRGLPRTTVDGNGDVTSYANDGLGRQTSYSNARGHTFSFQFDAAGRRTARTEPDSTFQTYTYDLGGNMTQHRKADASILTTTFNNLNLPTAQTSTLAGQFTNWTYDAFGRLSSTENQDITLSYVRVTGSNRIATETTIVKGLGNLTRTTTLGYDSHARHNAFVRSGLFNVTYTFDAAGRYETVTNDTPPPLATYTYNSNGQPSSIAHENALTTSPHL